jgi:hypothetical protein
MTVAQQPEGIGRRACREKFPSLKDLQLYQPNQNEMLFQYLCIAVALPWMFHR